jgi:tetratricopeptide (TPR) repeat protein
LLAQLRARIAAGRVLGADGAWEFYRSNTFPANEQPTASALIAAALESLGQACVGDYVRSTATGPKRLLLQAAVDAFDRLKQLRPNDRGIEVRETFCRARLEIAQRKFAEAVNTLQAVLKLDPGFACAYNALGVALGRLNRGKESRQAFDTAAKLTPEWALPPFQIASQYIAAGDLKRAQPFLEKAVAYNPKSVGTRWSLMHVDRLLGQLNDAEKQGTELLRLEPTYAPAYLELAQVYELGRNMPRAVEMYDAYVLLAPNYKDSDSVRLHADRLRGK